MNPLNQTDQGWGSEKETTRLQNRIVGFALTAILATGLAVGLGAAIPAFQAGKAAVETAVDYNVRLQAMALGQFTTRLGDMALQVTSRTAIRDRLDDYAQGRIGIDELRSFTRPKLIDALSLHPEAIGLRRLGPAGEVVTTIGFVPPDLPVSLPDDRTPLIAPPHHHEGESYLTAVAAINSHDGRRIGTDIVVFRDEVLHQILGDLDHLLPGATIYVAASGEQYFTHGHGSLVPDVAPREVRALVSGREHILRTRTGLLLAEPVAGGWTLAVAMPDHLIYAPALEELALPAVATLIMLLVASLGADRLLRPLADGVIRLARRLQDTSAEQQALLEYAHSFVFRVTNGELGTVSANVFEVLGHRPETLPAEVAAMLVAPARDSTAEGELPPYRLHAVHADGKAVVLEVHARMRRTPEGCTEVFGVARDITARADAEEALRASKQRLRTLIDASPDLICFKDGAGRCLEVNPAGSTLLDIDADRMVGRSCSELAHSASGAVQAMMVRFAAHDEQAWLARAPRREEETVPGPTGERILDTIRVPLFDDAGNRSGLLTIGRDVTERVLAERELARSAAEWTYAMDFLDDAIFLVDSDQHILRANRAAYHLVGGVPQQVIGRPLTAVLHPTGLPEPCRVCEALLQRRDAFITLELEHEDNTFGRAVEIMVKAIPESDGKPLRSLIGIRDLSRTRQTEEELHLAASVFEGSHEGIVITDAAHRILRANTAFTRITGIATNDAVGHTVQGLLAVDGGEDARRQYIWESVARQGLWQGEVWFRRHNGDLFPAWHRISALHDHRGEVLHYINLFTDITDKKLSEERIHHLAHYDVLTDLPNRLLFNDRLAHSMERAQRNDAKVGLLFLDLDHFKNVNDTLGHEFGDNLLQVIAECLRGAVREQDTVARLGGDEFTVVLEDLVRVQDAGVVANKILEAIAHPVNLQGHELFVRASIGISIFPDDGRDVQTLLRNADAAMYRAKEHGRNTYQYYTPELTLASIERLDLENALRRALERDELFLHYQPQVAMPSGRIIGAEALLRWSHPTKGLIPPSQFVPLAEDAGLMGPIGTWVIETACMQLRAWRTEGLPLRRVAVNLSGQQIIRGDLVATVRDILERTGVDPVDLELEITESFVMAHLSDGLATLNRLKELGVTLAIDDFGTGYSSLAYLKRLPIDRLKIDRSFVQDVPADRDDMAIAATIIAMAHNLDLQVIAEGVEQPAQADFLRHHRCDEVQGYLYGRPLDPQAFRDLIDTRDTA